MWSRGKSPINWLFRIVFNYDSTDIIKLLCGLWTQSTINQYYLTKIWFNLSFSLHLPIESIHVKCLHFTILHITTRITTRLWTLISLQHFLYEFNKKACSIYFQQNNNCAIFNFIITRFYLILNPWLLVVILKTWYSEKIFVIFKTR